MNRQRVGRFKSGVGASLRSRFRSRQVFTAAFSLDMEAAACGAERRTEIREMRFGTATAYSKLPIAGSNDRGNTLACAELESADPRSPATVENRTKTGVLTLGWDRKETLLSLPSSWTDRAENIRAPRRLAYGRSVRESFHGRND